MDWDAEMDTLADEVFTQLSDTITITRQSPSAITASTGTRTQAQASTSVAAVRGRTFTTTTPAGRVRRRVYSVRVDDLSFRPDAGDRVIDNGVTWNIVKASAAIDKRVWEITTERRLKS